MRHFEALLKLFDAEKRRPCADLQRGLLPEAHAAGPAAARRTYWPAMVAHLAPTRSTTVLGHKDPRTDWLLGVAGPFCPWPRWKQANYGNRQKRLAESLSGKLALPTHAHYHRQAVWLTVTVSPEEWQAIFEKHYRQTTAATAPPPASR